MAVLFGGRSAEHEVSLQSAKNVIEAMDRDKYELVLIGIDKDGRWYLNEATGFLLNADDPERIALGGLEDEITLPAANKRKCVRRGQATSVAWLPRVVPWFGCLSSFIATPRSFHQPGYQYTTGTDFMEYVRATPARQEGSHCR